MVKKVIPIYILFIFSMQFTYSQNKVENFDQNNGTIKFDITLSEIKHNIEINQSGNNVVNFSDYSDESKPGTPSLPYKIIFIALPSITNVTVKSSIISSTRINGYPQLNPEVILQNDSTLIYKRLSQLSASTANRLNQIVEIVSYQWIRDYYYVSLRINQYLYSNSNFIEQLNKVHIDLKLNNPNNFIRSSSDNNDLYEETMSKLIINYDPSLRMAKRSFSNQYDTLTSWIDYSKTYLKMGVNHDGIFKIKPADLSEYSIDYSSVDPISFKIFLRGKEIPIYVHYPDRNDPTSWDYIEFFGYRNMGSDYRKVNDFNTPYNEYLDRYSGTTIYWLTWGGSPGLRIDTLLAAKGTVADTVSSYTEILHYEENPWYDFSIADLVRRQFPEWLENETWVWGQQGVGTASRNFKVSDFVPNKNSFAYYKVQDFASDITPNAHEIGLSINTDQTIFGREFIDKYEQKVIHGIFSSSLLKNGNNSLNTISYPTTATLNAIAYDWYEIRYPRYLKAINDSLEFQIDDILSTQPVVIKITNVNSYNYSVYKISGDLVKISNFTLSNGEMTFVDTVYPGSKYFLVSTSKITKPEFLYKKKFVGIASDSNQADYILITHPLFWEEAKKYTNFITQNYQVAAKAVNVDDIYDEYNYGFFAPEPIKYFLQSAYNHWQSPKPSYVFLVGDANYDYYGNKVKYFGTPVIPNYVPSFGVPVSDTWFVIWDSTETLIPQMYIGRIPVRSVKEFEDYLQKHQNYLTSTFDYWNKRYIFISGGNLSNQSELTFLKTINDKLIDEIVKKAPIAGLWGHLYKTQNPPTNFGPYTNDQISAKLDSGGVAISYIGHSGTQIWDNGITEPQQIGNNKGKFSLVTDFGCSTGKFAEPDIKSFGEVFVVGQQANAIGYIGNSSLGFTSTTSVFPLIFYQLLLNENNLSFGRAHIEAKINMLSTYGTSGSYRSFVLCNTLFADPIIKLKIPTKPNLYIDNKGIQLDNYTYDSSVDSIKVTVKLFNYGLADTGSFHIKITSSYNDKNAFERTITKKIPQLTDSISFFLKIKNQVGVHDISVELDPNNLIDEIYKNDNSSNVQFNVVSNEVRNLFTNEVENANSSFIKFLNPSVDTGADSLIVQLDKNSDFSSSNTMVSKLDTFFTLTELASLTRSNRYWLRVKLKSTNADYSRPVSFYFDQNVSHAYFINDSLSYVNGIMDNTLISKNGIEVGSLTKKMEVTSAGFYEGGYATVTLNGNEQLSFGHLDGGPHVVVFDSLINFKYERTFNYWSNTSAFESNLLTFLDSVPANTILAFANSGGGGSGLTTKIKTAIKNFGSKYIDSVNFRYSWAMIGWKGANPGSVPEAWSKPFEGAVKIDSVFSFDYTNATYITSLLGPVDSWDSLKISSIPNGGSTISVRPIVINSEGITDTLSALNITNGSVDLSYLKKYSRLKFLLKLNNEDSATNTVFKSLLIGYKPLAELGTNFQIVQLAKDTLIQGETAGLSFYVYNAGESVADSFKVRVEIFKPDNSREQIFEQLIDSLGGEKRKEFKLSYNTASITGNRNFYISIDPDNKINELYKDNNIYTVPFYVKANNAPASLKLTFDGSDIIDGDYISPTPLIRIELDDQSLIPITDTNSVQIYLNGSRVPFNNSFVNYLFSLNNPKMVIDYRPKLEDGEYTLKVIGKNATGDLIDSTGIVKRFSVSKKNRLLDVYNYPNPFKDDTYFTFKLTQIPDEFKIKIFTIAGRLIKEIIVSPIDLNYDFNRIYWNGRDEDGNQLANGVYLYKIIMRKGNETIDAVQKLAIVR